MKCHKLHLLEKCSLSRNFRKTFSSHQQTQIKTRSEISSKPYTIVEGAEIEGFKVTEIQNVPDFNCKLVKLSHIATRAQYAHIDRSDANNVFAIAFRTTPFDSTGIPHILEHITLMGSKKYPCRDPFFKMLNRSLATYLNASTAPDFTVYPFATQNDVDYYNLMSVYLDAVFKPKLRENDFKLEGWRLEHEDVDNPESSIIFKGVVFNEMKGVFSENQNIFLENIINNLLPSHTYAVNSGGDPLHIPRLTYEKLVDFQRSHYHPSNSRIYSYGNFNLINNLKFVNDNYLKEFAYCEAYWKNTIVPPESRWSEPRRKHIYGKYDPLATDSNKQSTLAVSYLCEDIKNVYDLFELKVLTQLLTDGPNAPFYKNLVEPNIGSGYSPGTGFDTQTRDTIFTIGLQGLNEKDFKKVESIIYTTFDECIANGFDETNIENILHGAELNVKHQGSDFGINLLYSLAPLWNHDGNIGEILKITEHIRQFRKNINNNPFYLNIMLEKYFKNNNHRLILTMSPDKDYEDLTRRKENEILQETLSGMDIKEIANVYETGLQLRNILETDEDISCLPTLKISDISQNISHPNINFTKVLDVPLQICTLSTNNVTYFRSLLDVSHLSDEVKTLLPLFVQIVSQMGTRSYDYRIFDQMILRKTLGLNIGLQITDDIWEMNTFKETISLGSLCLDQNINGMFELWKILLNEVSLTDLNRFAMLVRNIAGDVVNGVADSGHHFAMLYASSYVSAAAYQREQFGGLTFIQKMKEIANTQDLEPILKHMHKIADDTLNKKRMQCALNVSAEQSKIVTNSIHEFMSSIRGSNEGEIITRFSSHKNVGTNKFHFVLPFAVNYVAKSIQCVPYTNSDFVIVRVLCKLLTAKYLLPFIRERYGAYGAGVVISSCGTIQFYSYRDPNSTTTASLFDEAGAWLAKNDFTESDIDEAKLGVFREVDVPISPSDQGMRIFLNGITNDIFDEHRRRILNVNREHLLEVASNYLNENNASATVIIGPENKQTESWEKVYGE